MYGDSMSTDLGGNSAHELGGALVGVTPRWFLPVVVWHPASSR